MPQIEVTFDIDANGIVNVTAKDKATNKEQPDPHSGVGWSCPMPISRRWSRKPRPTPRKTRSVARLVEAKNQAESLIHSTEKSLKEHEDKLADSEKSRGGRARSRRLRDALAGEDAEAITGQDQRPHAGRDEDRRDDL